MSGYISDEINRTVNWDGPRHCTERDCVANSEYMAGSYSSELRHFEDSIGALLPEPLSFARLLILFQDARKADKFELAGPFEDVSSLGADRHRYFCLTHAAWDNLGLGEALGADGPCWPNEQTAWRYLARYLSRAGNSWSYDGFLAYLLYRFCPKDAYITNVAKCYAGSRSKVFRLCAKKHLSLEIERFKPNMIISFTGRAESIGQLGSLARADVSGVRCFIRPLHPAVWNPQRKARLCHNKWLIFDEK